MIPRLTISLFLLLRIIGAGLAQDQATVSGKVTDEYGAPLYLADIVLESSGLRTYSGNDGTFTITVPAGTAIQLRVDYQGKLSQTRKLTLSKGETYTWNVTLSEKILLTDTLVIDQKLRQSQKQRSEVSTYTIDPRIPKFLPSAFNDFNKILVTLPGVTSSSELSSQYNVRGGNYDENLIYVNDIEIYRPFLIRSGQQEGLSFVNPDLVKEVAFSAGGWQPHYGDKLSSVLSVKYKVPYRFRASASASFLGGTAHVEGADKNEKVSYVIGARYKSAQYLLNTLPTKGQYRPRFFDVQSYIHFDLSRKRTAGEPSVTTLGVLTSLAVNRYFVIPDQSTASFGTAEEVIRLEVDFKGRETMLYETFQSGLKLSHRHSNRVRTDWIISGVLSGEREYGDVEGSYRLSQIDSDPASSQFNQPLFNLGKGGLLNHTRSRLAVGIWTAGHKGYYELNAAHQFQWGWTQSYESIEDRLSEYSLTDSAGYISITHALNAAADLRSYRSQAYMQHSWQADSSHLLTYGFRVQYWSLNGELLFSPRLQYSWKPSWKDDMLFKFAAGLYRQAPFYRELRDMNGVVHKDVKAQSSIHLIAGSDLNFRAWGRDFKFIAEVYGKYLYHVIPYDIDNVRIRYYGVNSARAYAAGADFRISGEFIKDAESWFSLGVLTTREDVEGDGNGYIRRPTDQRVTAAIFFQDHIPNNPSLKVHLNLVYGTGFPFGPPDNVRYRSVFTAPPYRRVDIGFSKLITYTDRNVESASFLESLWISLEVLNLLGVNNTISYLWITDVNQNRYAIPNTLSQRFINLRIVATL